MQPLPVGIIGCGNISDIYLKAKDKFPILDIRACADLDITRAEAKAKEHGIPKACLPDALLADLDIQIVVNLTVPGAHYSVSRAALDAGKHVYVEKPLSITRAEGQELKALAAAKGLRLGGAPDTFFGAGLQTCRQLIDEGAIGEPLGVNCFMLSRGTESWHPNPDFFYKTGGGPMFDMGPYYLTALISLLGPLRRVTGSARISMPERTITTEHRKGEKIAVDVPTHIAGVADFVQGTVATLVMSFDVAAHTLPNIQVYGSEGSLAVPDPNTFGGPVKMKKLGGSEWEEVTLTRPYADNSRGVGVADMAYAIQSGRGHRANGDQTYHVLDAMHGFHDASDSGMHYVMQSSCARPAALPLGLNEGELDD